MNITHIDDLVDWYKGETIFVLGNSSSLNELDLSLLSNYVTIGVQRILEVYEPSFVFIMDDSVIQDQHHLMNEVSGRIPIILYPGKMGSKMRALYPGDWISSGYMTSQVKDLSAKYGPIHIPPGGDSGYEATQLAYRMGASLIVLAGMDLAWRGKETHCFGNGAKRGCKLKLPKEKVECFRRLKQVYKQEGVELVSVSPWDTPLRQAIGYVPLDEVCSRMLGP